MDGKSDRTQTVAYMADTKRAVAHRRPGPERGVAAYRRTPELEQTILIGWPSDIGRDQVAGSNSALFLAVQQKSCSSPEIAVVRAAWHES